MIRIFKNLFQLAINLILFLRSSLSTQEEVLWTSDSNPGSDYVIKEDDVIKEDEQETVI